MTRQAYKSGRQIIDVTDFGTIDFDEVIEVSIPKFAWVVARSYLSLQAQWVSSYAVEYFSNGYDTPSDAQMDTIKANLADFLAEVEVTGFIVGQIVLFGGSVLPDGFLWCDGQEYDPLVYVDLYSVIGEIYGQIDGRPLLPDLEEKFAMGANVGHPIGETGGEETVTLTEAEMPSHSHQYNWFVSGTGWKDGGPKIGSTNSNATASTGGGNSHNNMPPYLALNFIIYAGG